LVAYVNYRQQAGFKPRATAAELKNFRGFWRDLLDQELVTNGAILLVKDPSADDPLPRYLTPVEFQRLAQHILSQTQTDTPSDRFDQAWFYLLAHTGIRLGELLNLRLSDCDLTGPWLRVRAGKGNRDRVLPLSNQVVTAIKLYLPLREPAQTDHLLIHRHAPVKRHVVPYRLRDWGRQVDIVPMSPHRLRHTLATFLINQGMPLVSLQKFLGHQDINKTLIYARVHDETVRQQFMAAMTHIEGLAIADWPIQLAQFNLSIAS
jgi:site-specific recombinase XerD